VLECTQPQDGICLALSINFNCEVTSRMGRIGRSWELIEKSVSILARNKSLMFLPVASAIASMAISVVMLSGGALLFRPEIQFYLSAGPTNRNHSALSVKKLHFTATGGSGDTQASAGLKRRPGQPRRATIESRKSSRQTAFCRME
jgi:hypothetical protein